GPAAASPVPRSRARTGSSSPAGALLLTEAAELGDEARAAAAGRRARVAGLAGHEEPVAALRNEGGPGRGDRTDPGHLLPGTRCVWRGTDHRSRDGGRQR